MNWSSSFMMASKMSLPKFKLNCGINGPGGTKSCNKSKIQRRSSGNPIGNGNGATGTENANPGGPGGGIGNDTDPQDEDAAADAPPEDAPPLRPAGGKPGNDRDSEKDGRQGILLAYISLIVFR